MNIELIEKAKEVYKASKLNAKALRKSLGVHPSVSAAEAKAYNCNALVEAYVAFVNMAKVNIHAEPLIEPSKLKLEQFLLSA